MRLGFHARRSITDKSFQINALQRVRYNGLPLDAGRCVARGVLADRGHSLNFLMMYQALNDYMQLIVLQTDSVSAATRTYLEKVSKRLRIKVGDCSQRSANKSYRADSKQGFRDPTKRNVAGKDGTARKSWPLCRVDPV